MSDKFIATPAFKNEPPHGDLSAYVAERLPELMHTLFARGSALETPDSHSRAPLRPIHSASLRGDGKLGGST
jgi:hypothetical protein